MEMQIPAVLGWYAESNQIKLSQHMWIEKPHEWSHTHSSEGGEWGRQNQQGLGLPGFSHENHEHLSQWHYTLNHLQNTELVKGKILIKWIQTHKNSQSNVYLTYSKLILVTGNKCAHRFKLHPILWGAAMYHKESRLHKKNKRNVVVSLNPCRPDVGGLFSPTI